MTDRDTLIDAHIQTVYAIASSLIRKLPAAIEYADLVQCGTLALIQAAPKYRINPNAFGFYVRLRVRGAMLDYARRFSPDTFELGESHPDPLSIEACLEARQIRDRVRAAVASLPRPERKVLEMKYNPAGERISQRQIATRMGMSQSRVSQRHRSGLRLLRTTLAADAA